MPKPFPLRAAGVKSATRVSGGVRHAARGFARHTLVARKAALSVFDKALVSTGVLTAVVSASFAAYMVSTDHPHPMFGGIEHLMIFAQPSHGLPRTMVAEAPAPVAIAQPGIDYTITGAIPQNSAPSIGAPVTDLPEPIVGSYVLHDVHDGAAIVVARNDDVYQVERGSILPGVGRVLAISRRGGKWVVVTAQGLITDGSF